MLLDLHTHSSASDGQYSPSDLVSMLIAGKRCFVRQLGSGGPVIYWGTFLHREDEITHLIDELEYSLPEQGMLLVAFLVEDWNRDFSPWEASAVWGDEAFGGKGADTLRWLQDACIPYIEEMYGARENKYLMGYSLAGLFAMWAAYECEMFDGIACCSGSLWFEGWDSYVSEHRIPKVMDVYLSLGGKEEKTKNAVMARVGDRTRAQEALLKMDEHVRQVVLEWNTGGHFADSGKRLVKGVKWLLRKDLI